MLLGLERLESTPRLTRKGVFQQLAGLPTDPTATTVRRFLLRLGREARPKLRRLHARLRARVLAAGGRRRFAFDVDAPVVVVYGHQEQARRGDHPTTRGRRSYHPLVGCAGQSRDDWAGELRPGDAHTAPGAVARLAACFARVPPDAHRVDVRGDQGFSDGQIVAALEDRRAGFVIVARRTHPSTRHLAGRRSPPHRGRVETAEFWSQPHRWPGPSRFGVSRRPLEDAPSAPLTLLTVQRYTSHVLVTNRDLAPINPWRFSTDRAALDPSIRELTGEDPLGRVPTKQFFANEASCHRLLVADTVVQWFKRFCRPEEWQTRPLGPLRSQLVLPPGQCVRWENRPILRLPLTCRHEDVWRHALKQINRLRLCGPFSRRIQDIYLRPKGSHSRSCPRKQNPRKPFNEL